MKQMKQIKGLSQQQVAHHNPIHRFLQADNQQEKADTLLEKCFKSLIKQKMSGCLINIERKRKSQEAKGYGSASKTMKDIENQLNLSRNKNRIGENSEQKTSTRYSALKNSKVASGRHKGRHNSTAASLNENMIKNLFHFQYTDNLTARKKEINFISKEAQIVRKGDTSFISAIEHVDDDKVAPASEFNRQQISKNQGESGDLVKLPQINNKFRFASPNTMNKNEGRRGTEQLINSDLWKFLTAEKVKKTSRRKTSVSVADANSISSSVAAKEQKKSANKSMDSSKQKFMSYISHLPPPFKRLIELVLSFLDIKFTTQISYQIYLNMIEQIFAINNRAWSVIAFLFWDLNRDGFITSRDVFDVFWELKSSDEKLQKKVNENDQLNDARKSEENQKKAEESKFQTIIKLQNVQKALNLFEKQIKRVNKLVSDQQQKNAYTLYGESSTVPYLEEAVIKLPNLKYQQVANLLGLSPQRKNDSNNGQKLEIQPKEMGVRCVSSYRQCFVSTQHNQQTRKAKQDLQNLKHELRQKRKNLKQQIQLKSKNSLKISREISYVEVAQNEQWQIIKDIVQNLLGYES